MDYQDLSELSQMLLDARMGMLEAVALIITLGTIALFATILSIITWHCFCEARQPQRRRPLPRRHNMRMLALPCLLIILVGAPGHTLGQERFRLSTPLGLDEYFPVPEDNPLTPEKIELGRRLFFDKLLSADCSLTCASCHKPELAFSDGLSIAIGVGGRKGTRSAPALINRAYGRSFFWDGRAQTLEEQVLEPIQNPVEMNLTLDELRARLKADAGYVDAFRRVFSDNVSSANVARALASFVRTLRSGNSPFDRFQHGDQAALSTEARRSLELFRGKANCTACHAGPNFTDEQFHNTGVSWGRGDLGRYPVTVEEEDRGAFKTPTLREIARTAPYMHDGSIATLEEVIEHYGVGTAILISTRSFALCA